MSANEQIEWHDYGSISHLLFRGQHSGYALDNGTWVVFGQTCRGPYRGAFTTPAPKYTLQDSKCFAEEFINEIPEFRRPSTARRRFVSQGASIRQL